MRNGQASYRIKGRWNIYRLSGSKRIRGWNDILGMMMEWNGYIYNREVQIKITNGQEVRWIKSTMGLRILQRSRSVLVKLCE